MTITDHQIRDIKIFRPKRHKDQRGFFSESYSSLVFSEAGIDLEFVQDNHSFSIEAGTIRGLHFQSPPYAQAKLVRCGRGSIFDVAVDARRNSPTYGHWIGETLSYENGTQLLIPAGFLHGFMTLEPNSEIIYKCTSFYAPNHEGSVRWDSCGIKWPNEIAHPFLSSKDLEATSFDEFESPFTMESSN